MKRSPQHALYLKRQTAAQNFGDCVPHGALVVALALWECAARLGWIDSFITSSPSRVWSTLKELVANGTLFPSRVGVYGGKRWQALP